MHVFSVKAMQFSKILLSLARERARETPGARELHAPLTGAGDAGDTGPSVISYMT
jgi:hypothetical protein